MPDRLPPRSRHIIISGALPERLSPEEIQAQQQKQLDNRNALTSQIQAISADYYLRMLASAALRNRDTENPPSKPYPFSRNRHSSWAIHWANNDRVFRDRGHERFDLDYTVDKDNDVVFANKLVVRFGKSPHVKPKVKMTVETDERKYVTDIAVGWGDDLNYYFVKSLYADNAPYRGWPDNRHDSEGERFVDDFCSFRNYDPVDFFVYDGYKFQLDTNPKLSIYRSKMIMGIWPMRWVTTFHYDANDNQFFRPLNDKDNGRCMNLNVSDNDTMEVDIYLAVLKETLGLIRASQ